MKAAAIIATLVIASLARQCPKSHPYPYDHHCTKCSSGARDRNGDVLRCSAGNWNPAGSSRTCGGNGGRYSTDTFA